MVERRDLGGPAGFDDGGGVGLADQGRTGDAVAREQGGAFEDRSFHVRAVGEHGDAVDRFGGAGFTRGERGLLGDGAGQRGLGGDGFNHDRPFRRGEAEPRSVCRGEVRQGGFEIAQRNDQRGFGAGIAQMEGFGGRYVLGPGALGFQSLDPVCCEFAGEIFQTWQRVGG